MKKMSFTFNYLNRPRFSILFVFLAIIVVFAVEYVTLRHYKISYRHRIDVATFQSPFSDIVVAKRSVRSIPGQYQKKYDFDEDMFTMNIPVWQKVLSPFKGRENLHYLEIGVWEGGSLIWMLENICTASTAKVTAIDAFEGDLRDRYYRNIEKSGHSDKVTTINKFSHLALRELQFDTFDIIYVDASHTKWDVLEDAVLSWRLLKEGGLLIFDDYRYANLFYEGTDHELKEYPKPAIDAFVQCFEDQLEIIHNDYQLILRKN